MGCDNLLERSLHTSKEMNIFKVDNRDQTITVENIFEAGLDLPRHF